MINPGKGLQDSSMSGEPILQLHTSLYCWDHCSVQTTDSRTECFSWGFHPALKVGGPGQVPSMSPPKTVLSFRHGCMYIVSHICKVTFPSLSSFAVLDKFTLVIFTVWLKPRANKNALRREACNPRVRAFCRFA